MPTWPPDIVLCQDCLAVDDFSQQKHEGAVLCKCGGEFCGCEDCVQHAERIMMLRHRSKTNSRRGEDLAFRKSYLADHPMCELHRPLRRYFGVQCDQYASDPHHICQGEGRRADAEWNLVATCREAHDFCHSHPVEGKLLCLYLKYVGGVLDLEAYNRTATMRLPGWLARNEPSSPSLHVLWTDLVEWCDRTSAYGDQR